MTAPDGVTDLVAGERQIHTLPAGFDSMVKGLMDPISARPHPLAYGFIQDISQSGECFVCNSWTFIPGRVVAG